MHAGKQSAEGRLARAGRPDHGEPLTGADREVEPVQDVVPHAVGEVHVLGQQLLAVGLGS